jgi:8-amino-7-oxononanoate synthase
VLPSLSSQLEAELDALQARHRLRSCTLLEGASRINVTLEGKQLVTFSSNDYLGLASHPALQLASAEAASNSGFGAGSSRLVCGTLPEHLAIEDSLASLVGTQAALLFPTGYQANLGVITALAGPEDLIVADRAVHASIIDGCRLSHAKLALYPHLDLLRAEKHLKHVGPACRRRFLITESLFSMDGDVAPLSHLAMSAKANDAALIVDEAHAIGCLGPQGSGLCAQFGVEPDILVGTLGKAIGASGAFVAGTAALRTYLVNRARSFLFTTALPPPLAAAALASVKIITSPEGDILRQRLLEAVTHLRSALGLPPDPFGSPIVPFILGADDSAVRASNLLRERGFLVPPIRPPTVREGTARLRITLSAQHTRQQVAAFAAALTALPPDLREPITPTAAPCHPTVPSNSLPAARPEPRPMRGIFLLGTDTGVGKSTVAAAFLHLLVTRGHNPVPFKPVETGADPRPSDALRLRDASMRPDLPIEIICPFPFPEPMAPAAAAAAAGVRLTLSHLLSAAAAASCHGSPLVVESAGGVLTPYGDHLTSADLATALGFPVLLIARNALGTVSHTSLAVSEIRRRSLRFLGIILVNTQASATPDQSSNSSLIANLTGAAPLGVFPYVESRTPALLAAALESGVDLRPILDLTT